MRDEELRARLRAYAEEGGQPRGVAPSPAQLRRRGHRALLGRAVTTLLLVVGLAAGGAVVWASRAGGHRDGGVIHQPGPAPPTSPPSTSPPPPTTTLPDAPSSVSTTGATAASAGEVVLTAGGLRGVATFGEPQDRVVARLRDRFGAPDEDRTWSPPAQVFGVCPGDRHRFLRWGRLFALFTGGATRYRPGGGWHFFAWYVDDHQVTGALDPVTAVGVRVGSTVAELRAAYGSSVRIFQAPPSDSFVIGRGEIHGLLSNTSTSGRVTQLSAGEVCGE